MGFSQKFGFKNNDKIIQLSSMNDDLKNSLWNVLYMIKLKPTVDDMLNKEYQLFSSSAFLHFFKRPIDDIPVGHYAMISFFKNWFFEEALFNEIYDFFEFTMNYIKTYDLEYNKNKYIDTCKLLNSYLERENSGYRFINDEFSPITDDNELSAIGESLSENNIWENSKIHLSHALHHLSDRDKPDYRNSIKESISAVEAVVRSITEESTMDKAMPKLENSGIIIPKMLKDAFNKLYHYTNDKNGIRHALMDESSTGFEEAKFMLVACSSFINYLKIKDSKRK